MTYRIQEQLDGHITPITSNNNNFVKGVSRDSGIDLVGRCGDAVP